MIGIFCGKFRILLFICVNRLCEKLIDFNDNGYFSGIFDKFECSIINVFKFVKKSISEIYDRFVCFILITCISLHFIGIISLSIVENSIDRL